MASQDMDVKVVIKHKVLLLSFRDSKKREKGQLKILTGH
jgi:hypothetical protein